MPALGRDPARERRGLDAADRCRRRRGRCRGRAGAGCRVEAVSTAAPGRRSRRRRRRDGSVGRRAGRRLGRLFLDRRRLAVLHRFAGLADERHQLRDRHRGARGHDLLEQRAARAGHQLHHRLVGLDLGQDVAHRHRVALALLPLDQAPLLHRGRERLHDDLGCHGSVAVQHRVHRGDDPGGVDLRGLLEVLVVGHRHVRAGDAEDRAHRARRTPPAGSCPPPARRRRRTASPPRRRRSGGSGHRREHRLGVERPDGAEVDAPRRRPPRVASCSAALSATRHRLRVADDRDVAARRASRRPCPAARRARPRALRPSGCRASRPR